MDSRDKYIDLDRRVSAKIMKEMEGKIVTHKCISCNGKGTIPVLVDTNGWECCGNPVHLGECCCDPVRVPDQKLEPRQCPECEGEGTYEIEY